MIDISQFISSAQEIEKSTGIPTSVQLAQIIQESTSRTDSSKLSGLATNAKNLFGVKGKGTAGSYAAVTSEYDSNGKLYTTTANFKKYNTYQESMEDHAKVLSADRYTKYTSKAVTLNDWVNGIKAGGYATDPNYAGSLINLIKSHNLDQYDVGSAKLDSSIQYLGTPSAITFSKDKAATTAGGAITIDGEIDTSGNRGIVSGIMYRVFIFL
jgi:flagellar protein FlgJ